MENYETILIEYLDFCKRQKRLDAKTIRAYRADLEHLFSSISPTDPTDASPQALEGYIKELHEKYQPRTVKRKIASAKAFYHYLESHEIICNNPWLRVQSKFREPLILPRIITLDTVQTLLAFIYAQIENGKTLYRRRNAIRDVAVCELLFATGIRIFELCSLTPYDVDLFGGTVLIRGKGAKERVLQIGNRHVHDAPVKYKASYSGEISQCGRFFANQSGHPFSDQAVRRMLNYYTNLSGINQHITPHMWRHTFATSLLDADVDIRYIVYCKIKM